MQLFEELSASNAQKTKKRSTNQYSKTMKRILFLLTVALTASFSTFAVPTAESLPEQPKHIATDTVSAETIKAITEIVRNEIRANKESVDGNNETNFEKMADGIVPITAISMPFITVIVIVLALIAAETKRRRRKYELVEKAIQANYQIPPYVFQNNASVSTENSRKALKSAIIFMAVGFSLSLFFLVVGAVEVASLVLIIFLIGLGKLIVAVIDIRNESKSLQQDTIQNPFIQENAEQD